MILLTTSGTLLVASPASMTSTGVLQQSTQPMVLHSSGVSNVNPPILMATTPNAGNQKTVQPVLQAGK